MKKLIYAICMGAAVAFSSCEDMLDTTNYTEKTTATFPESYDDAQQMIAGVYASMASVCANPERSFLYYAQLASDDALGGGGSNDKLMQAMDLLCNYQSDMTRQFWKDRYAGVFRANSAIETLDNCPDFPSTEARNQLMACLFLLRASLDVQSCTPNHYIPDKRRATGKPRRDLGTDLARP